MEKNKKREFHVIVVPPLAFNRISFPFFALAQPRPIPQRDAVSCSLFQQLWFLMKSLMRLGQLGHQKERQGIAPFIPGGVGVAALILRWKQTTVRKIQKTSQCFTLLCLLQPFSAALVSHEITHASWPTRPSKRKARNCPVYPRGGGGGRFDLEMETNDS